MRATKVVATAYVALLLGTKIVWFLTDSVGSFLAAASRQWLLIASVAVECGILGLVLRRRTQLLGYRAMTVLGSVFMIVGFVDPDTHPCHCLGHVELSRAQRILLAAIMTAIGSLGGLVSVSDARSKAPTDRAQP